MFQCAHCSGWGIVHVSGTQVSQSPARVLFYCIVMCIKYVLMHNSKSFCSFSPGVRQASSDDQLLFGLICPLTCARAPMSQVEGATGDYHTNLSAKKDALVHNLTPADSAYSFGFLHVKAVDDAGHDKNHSLKVLGLAHAHSGSHIWHR
jgi:hypothetical protein